MHMKAAQVVMLCMTMKWLSIVGSGGSPWMVPEFRFLTTVISVDAVGKGWLPGLGSASMGAPELPSI